MQVRLAAGDEVVPELLGGFQNLSSLLGAHPALLHHRGSLVVGEEVGHLAAVEEVVYVLDVGFVLDLGVGEEEYARSALGASRPAELFQILLPLHRGVRL